MSLDQHLLIGSNGVLGSALLKCLEERKIDFMQTTRAALDLASSDELLSAKLSHLRPSVVYLVAAVTGMMRCRAEPMTWVVNADAPVAIARQFKPYSFVVFVSSSAVEEAPEHPYAIQKAHVESYIHTIDGAIIRPYKFGPDRAPQLADFIIDVGVNRKVGVHRWK